MNFPSKSYNRKKWVESFPSKAFFFFWNPPPSLPSTLVPGWSPQQAHAIRLCVTQLSALAVLWATWLAVEATSMEVHLQVWILLLFYSRNFPCFPMSSKLLETRGIQLPTQPFVWGNQLDSLLGAHSSIQDMCGFCQILTQMNSDNLVILIILILPLGPSLVSFTNLLKYIWITLSQGYFSTM